MDITDFAEVIRNEFGHKLEHATPANMRKFLCRVSTQLDEFTASQYPVVIPQDEATNYEQVVAEFLARVLDLPPEKGVVLLWLFASELFYARLGEQYDQNLRELLRFDLGD